ncbi:MAG TPA: hypothetical protein VEA59_04075 [Patescibacteria group bacterium]|nr:hypothetical protein [Patescibacteria group bacterium]
MKHAATTFERINISLPKTTVKLIDKFARKGGRSRFIDTAVRRVIAQNSSKRITELLKEQAQKNASEDLKIVQEWFELEQVTMYEKKKAKS